jgi:ComF family protein
MKTFLETLGRGFVELCYPRHCQFCDSRDCADATPFICCECADKISFTAPPLCARCGLPFEGEIGAAIECPHCHGFDWSFERAVSAVRLRGVAQEVLHRFKYNRQIFWRVLIGEWICCAADRAGLAGIDAIVPVPLFPRRQREREYNQAALLAEDFGRWSGWPVLTRTLRRIRDTSTQTRLDREERLRNQRNAYEVRSAERVEGKVLCLLDDVWTTGATTEECAKTLLSAGAKKVLVLTAARS